MGRRLYSQGGTGKADVRAVFGVSTKALGLHREGTKARVKGVCRAGDLGQVMIHLIIFLELVMQCLIGNKKIAAAQGAVLVCVTGCLSMRPRTVEFKKSPRERITQTRTGRGSETTWS